MPKGSTGTGHGGPAKGVGKGDGWGGPPSGRPGKALIIEGRPSFEPGNLHGMTRNGKAERRAERSEQMETVLYNLALGAEREETQMNAAVRLHAIYNGQPVAKVVSTSVDDVSDLSDDAIRAELAILSGASPDAGEGT
jgi:hypothetical protein